MRFCRRDQVHSSRPDPTTANWWCRRRGRHRTFLRATAAAVETVVVIWKGELSLYTATKKNTKNTHTLNSSKEFVCAQIRIKITFFECAQTHVQKKIQFPQPGNRNRFLDTVHARGDLSRPRPNDKRARARALFFYSKVT